MKKLLLILIGITVVFAVNSQTLDEIVKRQSQALKEQAYDNVNTLKITGKMSQMGMEMTMTTWFKTPNKLKLILTFNGQDIVQLYDGTKGYMINPMTGSDAPQELPASQTENMKNNSSFKSPLSRYMKEGKLTLEGSENVKDKPAFKIKAVDGENTYYFYIDKSSFQPVKMSVTSSGILVDSYQEWGEVNGLMLPKRTTTQASGMEFVMTLESAEINVPLEDSFFTLK